MPGMLEVVKVQVNRREASRLILLQVEGLQETWQISVRVEGIRETRRIQVRLTVLCIFQITGLFFQCEI